MKTNEKFLSFYYRNMKEIPDIHLDLKKTALLIVDMQKHFIAKDGYDALQCKEAGEWDEWEWFYDHVDSSDRSRVQSTVGWNDIYVYVGDDSAKMVDELTPLEDEIVVNKTTDSVSLGTNYTQILHNMGIDTVIVTGVVTDQCVASTIRVLADQGFRVICPEDSCAAATQELHEAELRIMNVIYCTVLSTDETIQLIEEAAAQGTPAID